LRLFSFGGYGLALAALALVFFGAYDSYRDFVRRSMRILSKDTRKLNRQCGVLTSFEFSGSSLPTSQDNVGSENMSLILSFAE